MIFNECILTFLKNAAVSSDSKNAWLTERLWVIFKWYDMVGENDILAQLDSLDHFQPFIASISCVNSDF